MSDKPIIGNQAIDYAVTTAKVVLGALPAGSLFAELVGTIIPNQRIDRLSKFAEELDKRLFDLSGVTTRLKLTDENFTDILEEGLRQAARSTSDERREYISSIIANGISLDKIDFIESKHLLRILSEVNDIEIIWLRSYMIQVYGRDKEFHVKHEHILKPIFVHAGLAADAPEHDKDALQWSYNQHLVRLGLLEPRHKIDRKTGQLAIDRGGQLEVSGYEITKLGGLFLKYIGLTKDGFNPIENTDPA